VTPSVAVDIQVASDVESVPDDVAIAGWLELAVASAGKASGTQKFEISVRIVDEGEGRELNHRFRQQDKVTNVLSFPAECVALPKELPCLLGDIVVCGPVVEREAIEQGKDVRSHWAHLLVHGALHLLGFDHESENEAEVMEAIERKILAASGIDDPYAVRH